MPKFDFNCNFIERHGCSPINLLHIFKIPFPKNTSGGLFLLNLIFKTYVSLPLCCSDNFILLAVKYYGKTRLN